MDKDVYMAWLLDFYGGMLTQRQRFLLSQHLDEDFSVAEIASMEGISRQGVYDAMRKGEERLLELEKRLGLLRRYFGLRDGAAKALEELSRGENEAAVRTLTDTLKREGD